MTITLPFSAGWFWVGVITLSVLALSWLAFHTAGKRADKNQLPRDWQMTSLRGFAGIMTPVWVALLILTIWHLFNLWFTGPPEDDKIASRLHYLAIVGLMTALGGLVGLPLALLRVFTTERQVKATETGLITDRINKAVEGLGAEKTVKRTNADGESEEFTEANVEVRIGAIYSLERIAQDSDREHDQETIVKILAAYIVNGTNAVSVTRNIHLQLEGDLKQLRSDLKLAILSLARCWATLDDRMMRHTIRPDLCFIVFRDLPLLGFDFLHCNLNLANFSNCLCMQVNFTKATLVGVVFENTTLDQCGFREALISRAQMNENTSFSGSEFYKVGLHELDLTKIEISQEQVEASFGDATVTLPEHLSKPSHWITEELSFNDFMVRWRVWRKSFRRLDKPN